MNLCDVGCYFKYNNTQFQLFPSLDLPDPQGFNARPDDPDTCKYKHNEYWAIGEYIGGNGPLAYIRDAAFDVTEIGKDGLAEWRIFDDVNAPDPYLTDSLASFLLVDTADSVQR